MKKRILALVTVLLLAVLMTAMVSAADPALELATPGTGVDYSALTEGQTFDVYVLVPMTRFGTATSKNYMYRVTEDTATAAPGNANAKLTNYTLSVTWDEKSLALVDAATLDSSANSTTVAGDGYNYVYLTQKTVGSIQIPSKTTNAEAGTLVISYGSNATAAFVMRNASTVPQKGVITKLTFRVITGAEGGDNLPIVLNRSYTYNGTAVAASPTASSRVTVNVAAGCKHENKIALTPEELAANGKTNVTVSCIAEGETWYQCNDECGEIIVVTTPKLAHNYTLEKYIPGDEPTCLKKGHKAMFCSVTENCTEYDPTTVTEVGVLPHDFADANYAYLAPDCTTDGYELYWCTNCHYISEDQNAYHSIVYDNGEFTVRGQPVPIPDAVKLAAYGHSWAYDRTEGDVEYYKCIRCGEEKEIATADTVRYVSNNGTGDGKTASAPTTIDKAFDAFVGIPAGVDCYIYLVDKVTLPLRTVSADNTAPKSFEETKHDATVTITTAPGMRKGELHFPFDTVSMYHLYGPTVFDNIKVTSSKAGSTSGSSASITIYARGFDLTMTENFETYGVDGKTFTYAKTDGSYSAATSVSMKVPNCKLYLCGGIYVDDTNIGGFDGVKTNNGITTNMYVYGGTYWVVSGVTRISSNSVTDAEANIHVGGKAQIAQLIPFNGGTTTAATGTVSNIHYYSGFTGTLVYRAQNSTVSGSTTAPGAYTVNHFFHRGSGDIKVGDFMMGTNGHYKTVNVYYMQNDAQATRMAVALDEKGRAYTQYYGETQEFLTFSQWCVKYGGGHDYVDGVCSFCELTQCAIHGATERVVVSEPTCSATGLEYDYCKVCFEQVGDDIIVDIDENAHNYAWSITARKIASVCSICHKERATLEGDIPSTIYVSDNGYGDGGLTPDYPLNDFNVAMRLAAKATEDTTVYIVGKITLKPNWNPSTHAVFAEYDHTHTITICGYNNNGVFAFPGTTRTGKVLYCLNGPTVFENVEFSTWNNKASSGFFYLTAQHNPLVLGENITIDYLRNHNGQAYNNCSPVIVGGCYHGEYAFVDTTAVNTKAAECTGNTTDVTLCSGSYYEYIGGSVGGTCSLANGTINTTVCGDVSFRDYFSLGSFNKKAGDIVFNLDGTVSAGSYFAISGANSNPKYTEDTNGNGKTDSNEYYCNNARATDGDVKNVILKIYDGAIFVQSFETTNDVSNTTNRPLGAPVYGYFDSYADATADYDITRHLTSLKIYYDASNSAAEATAKRFLASPHTKTIETFPMEGKLCEATNGDHVRGTLVTRVPSKCDAQGYEIYECTNCTEEFTVVLAAVAHTFGAKEEASAANCINPQIMKETCSVCGYIQYSEGTTPATGVHTFGTDDVCDICSQSKQDLCTHVWDAGVTVTTGCGTGLLYTCTNQCGKTKTEITGADHNFGKYTVTVQPTATEPGVKSRTCKSCGKVENALLYADGGAMNSEAIAVDSTGALADVEVAISKLSKAEKAAIDALLQDTAYGSEVKVSYDVDGNVTGITYSIPLPAEYAEMQNLQVIVKDDEGKLHVVQFTIEKGFIVFTF